MPNELLPRFPLQLCRLQPKGQEEAVKELRLVYQYRASTGAPVVQDPSRTGEQLVLTGGGRDGSRGRGDVSFLASTGAPAAAPCGGTGRPELASKAEVLQEPTSCIDSHQPPQTGAQLAPSGLREPLWPVGTKGIRSCVGGVITPDALAGLRVCAREGEVCRDLCFPATTTHRCGY